MDPRKSEAYERAIKKVEDIKKFYKHLRVYLVVNVILFLIKVNILGLLDGGVDDLHFDRWLDLNVYGTAFLWGIGLLLHGLYVFQYKFKFLKNWETRKVKKILEDQDKTHD
ncbi:MAG: 2TM domain-containing protein [Marinirhabdus sp.]|nr:2TM domain-containing protein [Marinirhabdus sp.]